MHSFHFVVVLLSNHISSITTANILCTAMQTASHMEEIHGATEALSRYGHTIYTAVSSNYPYTDNFKQVGSQPLIYEMPQEEYICNSEEFNAEISERVFRGDTPDITLPIWPTLVMRDCKYMMKDKKFLEKVKSKKIDLVVADGFIFMPCNVIIAKYLHVPFVSVTATPPAHLPRMFDPAEVPLNEDYTHQPNLFRKLKYSLMTFALFNLPPFPELRDNTLLEEYAPGVNDWHTLHREALLFIMTRDHVLEWPTVSTPNVLRLPGLSYKPAKSPNAEFEAIMENARTGVIVFSFGSMGAILPKPTLETFLAAFSRLNYTVIMRCIPPEDTRIPSNVKMMKWLPQNDLLGHPSTKLFITHCGNGGQYQSVYHAVPMIGFPLFAEQTHNAFRMEHKNIGIQLNIYNFTSDDLIDAVTEILSNNIYRDNVKQLSNMLHDLPVDSKNQSAFWIDHVIKYGGKHLRSHSLDMPWYEFLMLDVLAVISIVSVLVGILCFRLVRFVLNKLVSRAPKVKRE